MLTTRRAFVGVTRMCFTRAMDSTISLYLSVPALAATTLLVVLLVSTEGAGGSKLSELVPNHRLGDKHRDVLASVVHCDGVSQERRDDHRATRPGLDNALAVGFVRLGHLAKQVVVNEGALFETAWHPLQLLLALLADIAAANDELVALFVDVAGAALFLAPRADRVASTRGLALSTTVRVVDRVHGDTTHCRANTLPAHAAGLAPVDVRLLGVADLADGCTAARVDVADFTGRQAELRVRAVLGDEANTRTG